MSVIIPKEIFRAYDIRGVVGESLTDALVVLLGKALGTMAIRTGDKTLVVGRDGRLSGEAMASALKEGILATGCDVVDIGMVPTPVLYFATQHLQIASGVMITGSHNPPDYNGFKIIIGGETLYGDKIQALYQMMATEDFHKGHGKLTEQEIIENYLYTIKKDIQLSHPLKVVVDCGNGVAGKVAPQLYAALGCEIIPLYCEVDGHFPNHHPDPGQPENLRDMIKVVKETHADIGLAFDGDGDRLGMVDNEGNIIWPDRQLILFAKDILTRKPGAQIIFDVKCTRHVKETITELGGKPLMWKTGHSLIKAKMKETGALLAGEMSGHLFFKERWFGFDDGLYAGARLLEIIAKEHNKQTAAALFARLPNSVNTPEILLAVPEESKFQRVQQIIALAHFEHGEISTIDGLRLDFADGFGLVRPSNTSPALILRFEGDTLSALERIKAQFKSLLLAVEPTWNLPF
jgi:phosphomannomutase/phosphoglucomutase